MLQAALKCGKNCNFLKIVIEAPKERQRTENVTLFKACLFVNEMNRMGGPSGKLLRKYTIGMHEFVGQAL